MTSPRVAAHLDRRRWRVSETDRPGAPTFHETGTHLLALSGAILAASEGTPMSVEAHRAARDCLAVVAGYLDAHGPC